MGVFSKESVTLAIPDHTLPSGHNTTTGSFDLVLADGTTLGVINFSIDWARTCLTCARLADVWVNHTTLYGKSSVIVGCLVCGLTVADAHKVEFFGDGWSETFLNPTLEKKFGFSYYIFQMDLDGFITSFRESKA